MAGVWILYSPLRARNENTPPFPAGVATGNVRAYPSSPSTKQFIPPLPADLQVPVMKIVPSLENIEGANRLLGHLKEALQNLQPTSLAGRHNTPFQSSDFSTVSALLPAQRLPQLLPNVQQLDKKLEWVRSVLTSSAATMECYDNSLREKDKKITDLEDRASRMEERLRRLEAEETEQPIRKQGRNLRQNRDINVEVSNVCPTLWLSILILECRAWSTVMSAKWQGCRLLTVRGAGTHQANGPLMILTSCQMDIIRIREQM